MLQHARARCGQSGREFVFKLQQQPFGGFFANAWHFNQAAAFLRCYGLRQIIHTQARQNRQRRARAHTTDFDKLPKRRALLRRGKTKQQLGIFAYHKMRQQRNLLAQRGQVVKRAHWHIYLIAHAAAIHQHLRRRFIQQRAC